MGVREARRLQTPASRRPGEVDRRDVAAHAGAAARSCPAGPTRRRPTTPRSTCPSRWSIFFRRRQAGADLAHVERHGRGVVRGGHDQPGRVRQRARAPSRSSGASAACRTTPGRRVRRTTAASRASGRAASAAMWNPIYFNYGIAIHGALERAAGAGVARLHPHPDDDLRVLPALGGDRRPGVRVRRRGGAGGVRRPDAAVQHGSTRTTRRRPRSTTTDDHAAAADHRAAADRAGRRPSRRRRRRRRRPPRRRRSRARPAPPTPSTPAG